MKKIVITGMGAVTPVGIGVDEYWKNIIAGKSGIDTIKSFDPSGLAVQFAGEIKDFDPTEYLPKDLVRKTDPFMQYAYIAAEEALFDFRIEVGVLDIPGERVAFQQDSGLIKRNVCRPSRTGGHQGVHDFCGPEIRHGRIRRFLHPDIEHFRIAFHRARRSKTGQLRRSLLGPG